MRFRPRTLLLMNAVLTTVAPAIDVAFHGPYSSWYNRECKRLADEAHTTATSGARCRVADSSGGLSSDPAPVADRRAPTRGIPDLGPRLDQQQAGLPGMDKEGLARHASRGGGELSSTSERCRRNTGAVGEGGNSRVIIHGRVRALPARRWDLP
jgi:hypothetical protein